MLGAGRRMADLAPRYLQVGVNHRCGLILAGERASTLALKLRPGHRLEDDSNCSRRFNGEGDKRPAEIWDSELSRSYVIEVSVSTRAVMNGHHVVSAETDIGCASTADPDRQRTLRHAV